MVGKYALISAMEIQKIQIVVHIIPGFASFMALSELWSWIPLQVVECEQDAFCITVQGIFVGIIIKASAASLKVTDLLFAFAFYKK